MSPTYSATATAETPTKAELSRALAKATRSKGREEEAAQNVAEAEARLEALRIPHSEARNDKYLAMQDALTKLRPMQGNIVKLLNELHPAMWGGLTLGRRNTTPDMHQNDVVIELSISDGHNRGANIAKAESVAAILSEAGLSVTSGFINNSDTAIVQIPVAQENFFAKLLDAVADKRAHARGVLPGMASAAHFKRAVEDVLWQGVERGRSSR